MRKNKLKEQKCWHGMAWHDIQKNKQNKMNWITQPEWICALELNSTFVRVSMLWLQIGIQLSDNQKHLISKRKEKKWKEQSTTLKIIKNGYRTTMNIMLYNVYVYLYAERNQSSELKKKRRKNGKQNKAQQVNDLLNMRSSPISYSHFFLNCNSILLFYFYP